MLTCGVVVVELRTEPLTPCMPSTSQPLAPQHASTRYSYCLPAHRSHRSNTLQRGDVRLGCWQIAGRPGSNTQHHRPRGRPTSTSGAVLSVDDSGSRQLRKVLLLSGEPFSGPILMVDFVARSRRTRRCLPAVGSRATRGRPAPVAAGPHPGPGAVLVPADTAGLGDHYSTVDRRSGRTEVFSVREVSRQEVQELLEQGVQVVDVLPTEEFLEEHLPGPSTYPSARLRPRPGGCSTRADRSSCTAGTQPETSVHELRGGSRA